MSYSYDSIEDHREEDLGRVAISITREHGRWEGRYMVGDHRSRWSAPPECVSRESAIAYFREQGFRVRVPVDR